MVSNLRNYLFNKYIKEKNSIKVFFLLAMMALYSVSPQKSGAINILLIYSIQKDKEFVEYMINFLMVPLFWDTLSTFFRFTPWPWVTI